MFRLQKTGPIRFLGHLETLSQVARAFRRAGVRVATSQGFHPHPLLKTAGALPLGVESLVERLLVTVKGAPGEEAVRRAVNAALPAGLALTDGRPARRKEPLPEPDSVTYHIRTDQALDPDRLKRFEQSESWTYDRWSPKGQRRLDLKATVKHLELGPEGLTVRVGRQGGRPKPAEILESIFGLEPGAALAATALRVAIQEKVEE
jgi:radical SAM-linked protein